MKTATELREDSAERDSSRLDLVIRDFIKRFEPEERRNRLDFEMELHHLVRAIYREASKPYEKILSAGITSLSTRTILQPTGDAIGNAVGSIAPAEWAYPDQKKAPPVS